MSYQPTRTDSESGPPQYTIEPVDGEPVEAQPVTSHGSDGHATIECWSCRNLFGIPAGTPAGSILACPICQNHNRYGNSPGPIIGTPIGYSATTTTTAVIAMPVQAVPTNSFGNISRARHLMTQMKCCWIAAVVLGVLMCFGGLYWGGTLCKNLDTGSLDQECAGVLYKLYAFVITGGGCMALLGSWGLYEIRKTNIRSAQSDAPLTLDNFKWVCHLGWILGTIIFIYSIGFLFALIQFVIFVPQLFTPCVCGVALGPVVWVNCCCYQNEFKNYQLQIELNAHRGIPMQAVQTQR